MESFLYAYQHLSEKLSPIAFRIGQFEIGWYSLMYLVGFLTVYLLLKYRIKKGERPINLNFSTFDFLIFSFLGLIIGARLGYVFFYDLPFYLKNPLSVISPIDPATGKFIGIYGLSYHGGLIGIIIATLIFAKIKKINFWKLANFIIPAVPAGYFFGRIGNFLNGELWGRATARFWGMYFPGDLSGALRHPSQFYEAILEGLLLFILLWPFRNNKKIQNSFLGIYITGYAAARIIVEFFREPDSQIGYFFGFLTLGQILSFLMLFGGMFIIIYSQKRQELLQLKKETPI